MFDPAILLQTVAIGLIGWNLVTTHRVSVDLAALKERMRAQEKRLSDHMKGNHDAG